MPLWRGVIFVSEGSRSHSYARYQLFGPKLGQPKLMLFLLYRLEICRPLNANHLHLDGRSYHYFRPFLHIISSFDLITNSIRHSINLL